MSNQEKQQIKNTVVMSKPLVTFAVFAYKQERFIREAVEGAFAQTYSPLEIILSDDCSTDRTFEIMQEMAVSYRGGHSVKLNRMAKNKGLAASINSMMALAAGELVVFAAGDDISLPQRVESLTSEWIRSGKPSGIASGLNNIDELGKPLGSSDWALNISSILKNTSRDQMLHLFARSNDYTIPGCSAAWSKETWNKFGDLMESVVNEDSALTFRSILDRGLHIIVEPLVLYRTHAGNIWNVTGPTMRSTPAYYKTTEETTAKRATLIWRMYQNSFSDLKTAVSKKMIEPATASEIGVEISNKMRRLETQAEWWNLPFFKRLAVFADSPHRSFPLNVTSLLPLNQHAAMRCLLARTKRKIQRS